MGEIFPQVVAHIIKGRLKLRCDCERCDQSNACGPCALAKQTPRTLESSLNAVPPEGMCRQRQSGHNNRGEHRGVSESQVVENAAQQNYYGKPQPCGDGPFALRQSYEPSYEPAPAVQTKTEEG